MKSVAFIQTTEHQVELLATYHSSPSQQSVRIWTDNVEKAHTKYNSSLTFPQKASIPYFSYFQSS